MTEPTRPMLAATLTNLEDAPLPALCSYKIDGIRCLVHPTRGPVSRSFKPIRNKYTAALLAHLHKTGVYLDGELVVLDAQGVPLGFNDIQSAIMSHEGQPNVQFWAFDCIHPEVIELPFEQRLQVLQGICSELPFEMMQFVGHVRHFTAQSGDAISLLEDAAHTQGFEGLMVRRSDGIYKSGRSTLRQGHLLKMKRWCEAEGVVVGFEELMINGNHAGLDELGLQVRKKRKDGMVPGDTLGKLVVMTPQGELRVGSGFDMMQRDKIWKNQTDYVGKLVTYKYMRYGMKELPRQPIFKGFRHPEDT